MVEWVRSALRGIGNGRLARTVPAMKQSKGGWVYPVEGGVVAAVLPPYKGRKVFEASFVIDAGVSVGGEE